MTLVSWKGKKTPTSSQKNKKQVSTKDDAEERQQRRSEKAHKNVEPRHEHKDYRRGVFVNYQIKKIKKLIV